MNVNEEKPMPSEEGLKKPDYYSKKIQIKQPFFVKTGDKFITKDMCINHCTTIMSSY